MSAERKERLAKLVNVLRRLETLEAAQHASHLAGAASAEAEARAIAGQLDAGHPMSDLFPELYHRRIETALAEARDERGKARLQARKVTEVRLRKDSVEKKHLHAARLDDRARMEKELLDLLGRKANPSR